MMLCFKAWLESRTRFFVAAGALAAYTLFVVVHARTEFPVPEYPTLPYTAFVWARMYGNAVPAVFSVIALLFGLGGLQREHAYGTAPFTLALPTSRFALIASRAIVGLLEIAVLVLVPAVLLPILSPVMAHQTYDPMLALRFSVLFFSWGAVWLSVGLLWSTVLRGEYAAPVATILTPFAYMIVYARVSDGGRRFVAANPFTFMSGIGQIGGNSGVFAAPLPWVDIAVLVAIAAILIAAVVTITYRESF